MTVEVPDPVRERALSNGDQSRRWLETLPEFVAELAQGWSLTLGPAFTGGTAAYVVAAVDADGRDVVLKVAMPMEVEDGAVERSVLVHRLADGRGCARLVAHDAEAGALLLERLGPNLHEAGLGVPAVIGVVADTLQTFWRPAPDDARLPTGADKADWLARFITSTWERLDKPCERSVIGRAVDLCDRRAAAYDPDDAVLVHGDAHGWNTLATPDGGWAFVDPEGIRSEKAHDLAVPMREYNEPLLAGHTSRLVRERAEDLAERSGVDPVAIWEWGFIERVSTGLANLADFDDGSGATFLEVARRSLT